jgi:RimJ/RimL family protein N-acetyltransferase
MIDCSATLVGKDISLRPIRADDFDALYAAASDPLIWEQHPDSLRYQCGVFEANVFTPAVASNAAYVTVDNASGKLVGSSRFYEFDADKKEIAIGYTFLSRDQWGGTANREMKQLMLDHAFSLGIERVWFHIGKSNVRSCKAMEKIGGKFSHEAVKTMFGVAHDYVFYTIDKPSVLA